MGACVRKMNSQETHAIIISIINIIIIIINIMRLRARGGGPAGPHTVYHNNITSVSRQHHMLKKSTQHLNVKQRYHITHQTNISTFHNRVTSISHLYRINCKTISRHFRKDISSQINLACQQFTNVSHGAGAY